MKNDHNTSAESVEVALAAGNYPAKPDGSFSGQGDAEALLREVCQELIGVGCEPCTGSDAPMEDLHGRIADYLARRLTSAQPLLSRPGDALSNASGQPAAVKDCLTTQQLVTADMTRRASDYMESQIKAAGGGADEWKVTFRPTFNMRDLLVAAMSGQHAADAKDAARYRWLRDGDALPPPGDYPVVRTLRNRNDSLWGASLDAAMTAGENPHE